MLTQPKNEEPKNYRCMWPVAHDKKANEKNMRI